MNTTTNTANNTPVCYVCRKPADMPTFFTIRGRDGTPFAGRVVRIGNIICDGCAECFDTAVTSAER